MKEPMKETAKKTQLKLDPEQVDRALNTLPTALRALSHGLDHIGVAVPSLREGLTLYRDLLGLPLVEEETVDYDGVKVAILELGGGGLLELLEPSNPDSPVAKFIAKRGGGVHHIALRVPDCVAAIRAAEAAGLEMIDRKPRQGAHGKMIAFVHPRSSGGVLLELCERRQ
jgi:methylmalonyl-CoA epimerase